MAKVKQLTVSLENRPGTLAHLAKVLADAKVNVVALVGNTAGAQGSAQVVVNNVNRAKKALDKAGFSYTEGTREQLELENKPGALAEFAGEAREERHQHRLCLCHSAQGGRKGRVAACNFQPSHSVIGGFWCSERVPQSAYAPLGRNMSAQSSRLKIAGHLSQRHRHLPNATQRRSLM